MEASTPGPATDTQGTALGMDEAPRSAAIAPEGRPLPASANPERAVHHDGRPRALAGALGSPPRTPSNEPSTLATTPEGNPRPARKRALLAQSARFSSGADPKRLRDAFAASSVQSSASKLRWADAMSSSTPRPLSPALIFNGPWPRPDAERTNACANRSSDWRPARTRSPMVSSIRSPGCPRLASLRASSNCECSRRASSRTAASRTAVRRSSARSTTYPTSSATEPAPHTTRMEQIGNPLNHAKKIRRGDACRRPSRMPRFPRQRDGTSPSPTVVPCTSAARPRGRSFHGTNPQGHRYRARQGRPS